MWYTTFDSAFWLTIAGIVSAGLGVALNACLKSRCKTVNICGMSFTRDTDAEDRAAMATINRGPSAV